MKAPTNYFLRDGDETFAAVLAHAIAKARAEDQSYADAARLLRVLRDTTQSASEMADADRLATWLERQR